MLARDMTRDQLAELLQKHGSARRVAEAIGQPPTTVGDAYRRHGLVAASSQQHPRPKHGIPAITRDMLDEALLPPNNCQVAMLLDAIRDAGQLDTLETVETMLRLPARELPAERFRAILKEWGFSEAVLPDKNHVATHRNSTLPCRCASHAAVKERG